MAVQPLTEEETAQLRDLLVRFLAYHGSRVATLAIGALAERLRKGPTIDVTPPPPSVSPPAKRKRKAEEA